MKQGSTSGPRSVRRSVKAAGPPRTAQGPALVGHKLSSQLWECPGRSSEPPATRPHTAPPPPLQYKPHNQTQHSDKGHKQQHHKGGKPHSHGHGKAVNGTAPPKAGKADKAAADKAALAQADAPAAANGGPVPEPVAAASS